MFVYHEESILSAVTSISKEGNSRLDNSRLLSRAD